MKRLSLYAYLLLFAVTSLTLTSCGGDDETTDPPEPPAPELNIIEWAQDNGNYDLLLAAAEKAGLTATLSDPANQFTIFGPDDTVFQGFLDAIGAGSVDNVDATTLGAILTNHAYLGLRKSTDLTAGYNVNLGRTGFDTTGAITTSAYFDLTDGVAINGGTAATGGATVVTADFEASNGIIHSVDNVIAPPNLVTFLSVDPELSMTLQAAGRMGMNTDFVGIVSNALDPMAPVPYSVFAPTNEGWAKYLADKGYADMSEIPTDILEFVLKQHFVPGPLVRAEGITDGMTAMHLGGNNLTFSVDGDGAVAVTCFDRTGNVVEANIQCQNGVMHKIDNVIDDN